VDRVTLAAELRAFLRERSVWRAPLVGRGFDVHVFLARPRRPPAHYHGCPECYEPEACTLPCSIEPDLGTHKGCPFGFYDVCSSCRRTVCDPSAVFS
jgi:hypothetical protein